MPKIMPGILYVYEIWSHMQGMYEYKLRMPENIGLRQGKCKEAGKISITSKFITALFTKYIAMCMSNYR
jgi:hypothetical protein